jgi:hypothetical protein
MVIALDQLDRCAILPSGNYISPSDTSTHIYVRVGGYLLDIFPRWNHDEVKLGAARRLEFTIDLSRPVAVAHQSDGVPAAGRPCGGERLAQQLLLTNYWGYECRDANRSRYERSIGSYDC